MRQGRPATTSTGGWGLPTTVGTLGAVALSCTAFAALQIVEIDRRHALETENARLERELDALGKTSRRAASDRTEAVAKVERALGEERSEKHSLAKKLARTSAERDRARERASSAQNDADSERARAEAALALAEASETWATELGRHLLEVERERDAVFEESRELRSIASYHLPEVAPEKAKSDLDQLREDLELAKASTGSLRSYRIGLACSALRTYESSASGYSDRLGQRLLQEARALRQDEACVEFDRSRVLPTSSSSEPLALP